MTDRAPDGHQAPDFCSGCGRAFQLGELSITWRRLDDGEHVGTVLCPDCADAARRAD